MRLCTLMGVLSDSFLAVLLWSGNCFVLLWNACGDICGKLNVFMASSSMWQRAWQGVKHDPHYQPLRKFFTLKNVIT